MENIAVFCGSSVGDKPLYYNIAYALGEFLASQKIGLVYGAAKIGIMGAVAKGALDNAGKVIGVIPEFLTDKEVVHTNLSELIVLDTMHQRKAKMNDLADAFIVLPGGFGTLEEFFEVLTWAQLGLHSKPIGILNTNGYYDHISLMIQKMVDEGFLNIKNRNMVLISDDIGDLFGKLISYKAPVVKKWLNSSNS